MAWRAAQIGMYVLDKTVCVGAISNTSSGIAAAILAYKLARFAKNAYKQQKYGVKHWVPKHAARECAVCLSVFKSLTLRKEFAKHHCATCGRVVCHPCSATKIMSEISKSLERICTQCLAAGTSVMVMSP